MEYKPQRIAILAVVFLLSTIFFWAALNQFLLPSIAQNASQLKVYIIENEIKCNPDPKGVCRLHLFVDNNSQNKLIGLSGRINYSKGLYFDRFTTDMICSQDSAGLDLELKAKHDTSNRFVDFAYGTFNNDDQLKTKGCVKTIFFRPDADPQTQFPQEKTVNLATNLSLWQAVGISEFSIVIDSKTTKIIIDENAPIDLPTDIPTPSGPVGNCPLKKEGDCNCDGKVSNIDTEMLRQEIFGESFSLNCDFNNSGKVDIDDFDIWRFGVGQSEISPTIIPLSPTSVISQIIPSYVPISDAPEADKVNRDSTRIKNIGLLQGVIEQFLTDLIGNNQLLQPLVFTVESDQNNGSTDCDFAGWHSLPLCPYANSIPTDPVNQTGQYIKANGSAGVGRLVYQINIDENAKYRICTRLEATINASKLNSDGVSNDYFEVYSSQDAPDCFISEVMN